jgi:hypothetical protein
MDESHLEKIARIDTNVQRLMESLSVIDRLDKDSVQNKSEHRIAIWGVGIFITPILFWVCKKLGIILL